MMHKDKSVLLKISSLPRLYFIRVTFAHDLSLADILVPRRVRLEFLGYMKLGSSNTSPDHYGHC
jgi:hypothetical protein